jgi:hypothetical protein
MKHKDPNRMAPRQGIHGGSIGNGETLTDRLDQRWRGIVHSTPAKKREVRPKQSEADRLAAERDAAANELEAVLSRTPFGRQMLDHLANAAKWRIHEALAAELVSSASKRVEALRRELLTTPDYLEQHKAATQIPEAERELAKWQRAHADYRTRREYVEAAIRDGMRAFA